MPSQSRVSLDSGSSPPSYFSAWLDSCEAPAFLVTATQRVMWTNNAADAVLDLADRFMLRNGIMACVDKAQASAMKEFLDNASEQASTWVCHSKGLTPIIVKAKVIAPGQNEPLIAITLFPTEPEKRYIWVDVKAAFNLTRTEFQVVARLLNGEGAEVIADTLGVSIETVRTHIRRLYGKLGVSNREQLFATVAPYRLG